MHKKSLVKPLFLLLPIVLTSCGGKPISSDSEINKDSALAGLPSSLDLATVKPGDALSLAKGIKIDEDNIVFSDFVNGVDPEQWIIGSGAWGKGNGGVVPENVFYTSDGTLLLRGNGEYYSKDEVKGLGTLKDGRNTGAALISRFAAKPGHYEVKMKPLPRLGACTAFWTYANRPVENEENDNHEIDIEMPGGKQDGVISFKNVLNTNYTKESQSLSKDIDLSSTTGGKTICLSDGQFHRFGMDWYTDPEVVIYSIDGIVTAVSSSFVPTLQGRLWLGNWYPNNAAFVGSSLFETDYMEIDYVSYLPFLDQPSMNWDAEVTVQGAPLSQYPTSPIVRPKVNKISNGDFEYFKRKGTQEGYGWEFSKLNTMKDKEVSEVCYLSKNEGKDSSCGAVIKDGGYLSQVVDSVYESQEYSLSFLGKAKGTGAKVVIRYRGSHEEKLSQETISLDNEDWKQYTQKLTVPEGCYSLQIQAFCQNGSEMVLDDFSLSR